MTRQLHCLKESGNSAKVARARAIAGLDWAKLVVDCFNGETRLRDSMTRSAPTRGLQAPDQLLG